MTTENIPMAMITAEKIANMMIVFGCFETMCPNKRSVLSRIGFFFASWVALIRGFALGRSEIMEVMKKRLATRANAIPAAERMPTWRAATMICPSRQSMPAIVVNPVRRIGLLRLLNIAFASSFVE